MFSAPAQKLFHSDTHCQRAPWFPVLLTLFLSACGSSLTGDLSDTSTGCGGSDRFGGSLVDCGKTAATLAISDPDSTSATTYDFGTVSTSSTGTKKLTITNSGQTDASSITGTIATPFTFTDGVYPGSGGTCSTTLAAGVSCSVYITYTPTTSGTTSNKDLTLSYTDGKQTTSATFTLKGTGGSSTSSTCTSSASTTTLTSNIALGTSGSVIYTPDTSTFISQSFTPSSSVSVAAVAGALYRVNDPGVIRAAITTDDGSGKPVIGTKLAYGTYTGSNLPTSTSAAFTTIGFTSAAALTAGTTYHVVFYQDSLDALSGNGGSVALYYSKATADNIDYYTSGYAAASANAGSSWTIANTNGVSLRDVLFKVFYCP